MWFCSLWFKEVSDVFVDLLSEGCPGCLVRGDSDRIQELEVRMPKKANQTVQGVFPSDVTGSKQYGQGPRILVALLRSIGLVSYKRIAKLRPSLGFEFSMGTIHSTEMRGFSGVVGHDFWKPYSSLDDMTHEMCAAHLKSGDLVLTWPYQAIERICPLNGIGSLSYFFRVGSLC